ncbi:MAG TPA: polymer-forming cytoskeletal protein [Candidatus Methylacidiphilales bacterium]
MPITSKTKEPFVEIHSDIVLKGQLSMAKDVLLTGKFEGDLKTAGCLTVATGGVILGSIEAGALVLESGHRVEARVKVGSPEPAKAFGLVKKINAGKWPLRFQKLKELAFGRK